MIYIRINENNEVVYKHFFPFDKVHGLNRSKEDLEKEGKFVDNIPTIECPLDKMIIEKYNHETNSVYCELIDRPKAKNDIIEEKISILEAENANLREGLQAVLSGDMQSLAYILYPEDFTNINESNTTLEL